MFVWVFKMLVVVFGCYYVILDDVKFFVEFVFLYWLVFDFEVEFDGVIVLSVIV